MKSVPGTEKRYLVPRLLSRRAVVAGPAGTGKTRLLLEHFSRLVKESRNPFQTDVLFLLPTAEHRERIIDLILRKEIPGFFGERVLTLTRLMQELLKAGDFSLVTDAERAFLVREIAGEKAGAYFSKVADFPGFRDRVAELLGELKEGMIPFAEFRKRMRSLAKSKPDFQGKYEELTQIYEAYEAKLEAGGLRDHRDGLFLLRETAREKRPSPPHFRHLFLDGFFDFSKSQLEFLGWLAERSERMTVAMTVDLSEARKGLFEIPLQTLKALEKFGFETVDLSGGVNHRAGSGSLRHIEKNLFTLDPSAASPPQDDPVLILEATGLRGEVEMIAREIRKLVSRGDAPRHPYIQGNDPTRRPYIQGNVPSGRPLHFSDIAVILRRIGAYEAVIRAVFREFGLPFEIHERERLRDTPLARTLASFFKVLLEDWKREDLFNFLKSSYVEKDYAEVCGLEIQGFRLGIAAGRERWLKEVTHPLFEKIRAFHDQTEGEKSVEHWIRFTEEAIRAFGLCRIPEVYEESARRDFAALRRLGSLLDEIRRTNLSWGSPAKSFESFAQEFLGLLEVDLFSLHERGKNRVQVYDISLARQKEYKVVFLAGLLEKQFPLEIREDPLLSDEERRAVGLPERLPRQALERYFFYLGLTRAREKAVLSYPRFDLEGREALPSFYVEEVERLFAEGLPKISYPVSRSLPRLEDVAEERELAAHLVKRLFEKTQARERRERALTFGLYNRFLEKPSFQSLLPRLLFNPAAKIEQEAVRTAFLPKGGLFKPTGLEIYGRCPYRYFASQILELEEEEEGIDARQVGIALHKVLEHYWKERVEKKRKELEDLETAKAFVRKELQTVLKKEPLTGEKGYRIELKKADLEEWLLRMVEKEIEEGHPVPPLEPRHFEFQFGFKGDPLRLFDSYREDLLLRGKVDRVEVDPSGKYALVIDYKTGAKFYAADLEFGTALQLPLYLLAVQQQLKLKPLGGEIYQIRKAESRGFYLKEALAETGAQPNSRAVYEKKDFDELLERTVRFSRKFAEGIRQAQIPVRPRDCDPHCPFPSVCRIEKWRLPFIYQEIREEDKKAGTVLEPSLP